MEASSASVPPTSGMRGHQLPQLRQVDARPRGPPGRPCRCVGSTPLASMKPVAAPPALQPQVLHDHAARPCAPAAPRGRPASSARRAGAGPCRAAARPCGVSPSSSRMPEARRSVFGVLAQVDAERGGLGRQVGLQRQGAEGLVAERQPLAVQVHVPRPDRRRRFCSRASNASWSAAYVCQRSPLPRPFTATSGKRSVPRHPAAGLQRARDLRLEGARRRQHGRQDAQVGRVHREAQHRRRGRRQPQRAGRLQPRAAHGQQ